MHPTLYFLRSSEQKIVTDMLHFAYKLDEVNKTLDEIDGFKKYNDFYGLTTKDLGIYALKEHTIAGAVWIRLLKDETIPILSIGVKPEFRNQGIATAMMEQLLLEVGTVFKQVKVDVLNNDRSIKYFEKFGFTILEDSTTLSPVDGAQLISMIKNIKNEAVIRPTDGYDPTRWMD